MAVANGTCDSGQTKFLWDTVIFTVPAHSACRHSSDALRRNMDNKSILNTHGDVIPV